MIFGILIMVFLIYSLGFLTRSLMDVAKGNDEEAEELMEEKNDIH